jgi:hypothetical protein
MGYLGSGLKQRDRALCCVGLSPDLRPAKGLLDCSATRER